MKYYIYLLSGILIFVSLACSGADEAGQRALKPSKIRVDADHDGAVDRTEFYDGEGNVERVESDTTGSGSVDEWVFYEEGEPVRSERDTNGDGKPDVWIDY